MLQIVSQEGVWCADGTSFLSTGPLTQPYHIWRLCLQAAEMSDSDDELMAALEAEMEDRSSGAVLSTGAGTGSSSSITSSDCSSKASASSSSMVQVEGINDEIANQIHAAEQWLEWEAAQSRPLERHQRRPPCRGGDDRCLIFELPEELQRRILRFVSIANLMSGVRFVSKHASGVALAEVRERIRGLLLDSLISGFETEMAPPGSSTAAAASSSSPPHRHHHQLPHILLFSHHHNHNSSHARPCCDLFLLRLDGSKVLVYRRRLCGCASAHAAAPLGCLRTFALRDLFFVIGRCGGRVATAGSGAGASGGSCTQGAHAAAPAARRPRERGGI